MARKFKLNPEICLVPPDHGDRVYTVLDYDDEYFIVAWDYGKVILGEKVIHAIQYLRTDVEENIADGSWVEVTE